MQTAPPEEKALSKVLRVNHADLLVLYEEAKVAEDYPKMERLSKAIAQLTKQIQQQELHEGEVTPRAETKRFFSEVVAVVTRIVREECAEAAPRVTDRVADELTELWERID